MRQYDFRCVRTGVLLPLIENNFLFAVPGAPIGVVTKDGISCSLAALLQLTHPVDILEMDIVINLIDLTKKATITGLFYDDAGLQVGAMEVVTPDPGVTQTIKFKTNNLVRIEISHLRAGFFCGPFDGVEWTSKHVPGRSRGGQKA